MSIFPNGTDAVKRFNDIQTSLNDVLTHSVVNASGSQASYYGYKSYAFGYLNQTISASISYEEFIKTTNYGKLIPYMMAIGSSVVSDAVKIPAKNNVIEPELLQTDALLNKLVTRRKTMDEVNSITCRTQCFGSCTGNCFKSCLGSCATNCSNTCGETCKDDCKNSCTGTCSNTCNSKCINTCSGQCRGCSGCGGCSSGCSSCSGCTGCSGTCSGSCSGGCGGACSSGGCKGCAGCSSGCQGCTSCSGTKS